MRSYCCTDVGAIIAAIIGGVVGGIVFFVCVGVGICYFAKCACFAPTANGPVTPAPTAQVQMAPQPQGVVMQPQIIQPQQGMVMQPQQGMVVQAPVVKAF